MLGPGLGGLVFARHGSSVLWASAAGLGLVSALILAALLPAFRRRFAIEAAPAAA